MAPDPERVARQQERQQVEHVTWFLDLFPGVLSRSVTAGSVIMLIIAAGLGVAFVLVFCAAMQAGGFVTIFETFLAVVVGCGAAGSLVCGLTWLMYGEMCFPPLAWVDFRTRHWVAFFTLVLAFVVILAAVAYLTGIVAHGR